MSTSTTTTHHLRTQYPKSISFDVLGTLFTIESTIPTIQTRLSPSLTTHSISARSLFFSWFYAAQRDFTYLSLSSAYTPIATVLERTFKRACAISGIPLSSVSDSDIEAVMSTIKTLPPRDGLKGCIDGLRGVGFEVYAVTNGGREVSLGYFERAGVELDPKCLISCDEVGVGGVAKPDARVYEALNGHLDRRRGARMEGGNGDRDGERWFVAAHAWDLIAARKAGFKTAYLEYEEHDPVTSLFGEFDIYAKDMAELLEKMKKVA